MLYLAGLKTVECTAIRKSTTNIQGTLDERKVRMPTAMMRISNALTATSTLRLLNASARWPAYPVKNSEGSTKSAVEAAR